MSIVEEILTNLIFRDASERALRMMFEVSQEWYFIFPQASF